MTCNTYPGEQGVKAMNLLPFSYISIILSHTLQRKLLHQVDLIGFLQVCILQKTNRRYVKAVLQIKGDC